MIRWRAKMQIVKFLTACGRKKDVPAAISLNQLLTRVDGQPKNLSYNEDGISIPRLSEMCAGLRARRLWNQTRCLALTMTVAVYFGELMFAVALAIVLLATSTFRPSI